MKKEDLNLSCAILHDFLSDGFVRHPATHNLLNE